ncbi:MAG: hypothetical protein SVR94_14210, partial [Pseudomonadota bacterium]|nr:hypothetical protein [Pseudomonadota bacterium]
ETRNIDVHYPKIESIQFNSENETVIRWKDLSNFESGFIIEKASREGSEFTTFKKVTDVPPNETMFVDTEILDSGTYYKYRISAKFDDRVSKKTTSFSDRYYIPKPNLMAVGTPGKIIKLSWDKPSDMARGYIIERRSKSEQFSELAQVTGTTLTYEDGSVIQSNSYTYRVKTLASDYSDTRSMKYSSGYQISDQQTLTQQDNFRDTASPTIQALNNGKIGIYSHHVDNEYDFNNSVFILDQTTLSRDLVFNTGHNYLSSYFSKDGQRLLQLESLDNFRLNIYNTNSGDLIRQIPNAHQNETSIVTEGIAKFNYDATLIASAINHDHGLKIWDSESGNLSKELEYDIFQIRNFEFHPSENTLAVLHLSGLDVWDISTKEKRYSLTNSNEYRFRGAITFSSSGDILYYSSNEKIFIVDNNTGSIINSFEISKTSHQIALNEVKNQIAVAYEQDYNQIIQILNLSTFEILQTLGLDTSDHPALKFDGSGKHALSVHNIDDNSVEVIKWVNEENWYNTNNN